jgi:methylphosphotriester-DNA--protein-cysteine methyltransferase
VNRVLLSRNFAPHDDLLPYIRRHYVFQADLPEDMVIDDQLLSETAFVRVLIKGHWSAETAPGEWTTAGPAVLFGGNSRPFHVRVKGPFIVAGFAIRPSAWTALFTQHATDLADTMVPLTQVWTDIAEAMTTAIMAAKNDAAIVAAMETAIRAQLARIGRHKTDAEMAQFEAIARVDSARKIEHIGEDLNLSVRQIERRCLATFGISPKAIMRRSRFLDMATALRGFSTQSEHELAALRYFDQSHLNREFRFFCGMPPGAFKRATTPLFTAGLQLRDQGKGLA